MSYWTVRLEAYSFDTEGEAKKFMDAMANAFTGMPEARGFGCSMTIHEVSDDDLPSFIKHEPHTGD